MKKQYEDDQNEAIEDKIDELVDVKDKKTLKGIQVFFITFGVSFVILMCVFLTFFILGSSATRKAGANDDDVPYYNDYKPQQQENINILIIGGEKNYLPPSFMVLLKYDAVGGNISIYPLKNETIVSKGGESKSLLGWYDYESIRGCSGAVETMLGVKIDRYIRVEEKGVANLVDYLGGIELDVKREIQCKGSTITGGKQLLDGRRVALILSSENAQELQGELFGEYFRQHFNSDFVDKYTKFISAFFYNAETNLNQYDFAIRQKGLLAGLSNNTISIEVK